MEIERVLTVTIKAAKEPNKRVNITFEILESETSDHVTIVDTDMHESIDRIGNEVYSWTWLLKDELEDMENE